MHVGRVVKIFGVILCLAGTIAMSACGSDTGNTTFSPRTIAPSLNVPYSQTDTVVGTGTTTAPGRMIFVSYTGWLYDPDKADHKGKQFDSSASFGFVLGIGSVIAGWEQGIPGMKVGGTRQLVIPPGLAYGSTPNGSIPANSTLLFEVTLLASS